MNRKPVQEVKVVQCVNGCNKPVKSPSKVLCENCLKEITKKLEEIMKKFDRHGQ